MFFVINDPIYKKLQYFNGFKEKAIDNNIRSATNYFKNHLNSLTTIVKHIQEGIEENTSWTYHPQTNPYHFQGKDVRSSYDLDIKTGQLLVNGCNVKTLSQDIKSSEYYKKIFGTRDFEVYPDEKHQYYRTNRNFSSLFNGNINEQEDKAFFQFGYVDFKSKQ